MTATTMAADSSKDERHCTIRLHLRMTPTLHASARPLARSHALQYVALKQDTRCKICAPTKNAHIRVR